MALWYRKVNDLLFSFCTDVESISLADLHEIIKNGIRVFELWIERSENEREDRIIIDWMNCDHSYRFLQSLLGNSGFRIMKNESNSIEIVSFLRGIDTENAIRSICNSLNEFHFVSHDEFGKYIEQSIPSDLEHSGMDNLKSIYDEIHLSYSLPIDKFKSILSQLVDFCCENDFSETLVLFSYYISNNGWLGILLCSAIDKRRVLKGSNNLPLLVNNESLLIFLLNDDTKVTHMGHALELFFDRCSSIEKKLEEKDSNAWIDGELLMDAVSNHSGIWELLDAIGIVVPIAQLIAESLRKIGALIEGKSFLVPEPVINNEITSNSSDKFVSSQFPWLNEKETSLEYKECESLRIKGNQQYSSGEYLQACNYYTDALSKYQNHCIILANRAACYLQLEKYELAINDCELYLQLPWQSNFGDNHKNNSLTCKVFYRMAKGLHMLNQNQLAFIYVSHCFEFECATKEQWQLYKQILSLLPTNYNPASRISPWMTSIQTHYPIDYPSITNILLHQQEWENTLQFINSPSKFSMLLLGNGSNEFLCHFIMLISEISKSYRHNSKYSIDNRADIQLNIIEKSTKSIARDIIFLVFASYGVSYWNSLICCKNLSITVFLQVRKLLSELIENSTSYENLIKNYPWIKLSNELENTECIYSNFDIFLSELRQYWLSWNRIIQTNEDNEFINPFILEDSCFNDDLLLQLHELDSSILQFSRMISFNNISEHEYREHKQDYHSKTTIIFHIPSTFIPIQYENGFDCIITGQIKQSILPIFSFLRVFMKNSDSRVLSYCCEDCRTLEEWKSDFEYQFLIEFELFCKIYHMNGKHLDVQSGLIEWTPIFNIHDEEFDLREEVEDLWNVITIESRTPQTSVDITECNDISLNTASFWSIIKSMLFQCENGRDISSLKGIIDDFFVEMVSNDDIYNLVSCHIFNTQKSLHNSLIVSDIQNINEEDIDDDGGLYVLKLFGDSILLYSFVNWNVEYEEHSEDNYRQIFIIACLLSIDIVTSLKGEKLYNYLTSDAVGRDMQIIDHLSYQPKLNLLSFYYPQQFYEPNAIVDDEQEIPQPVFLLFDQTYNLIAKPLKVKKF